MRYFAVILLFVLSFTFHASPIFAQEKSGSLEIYPAVSEVVIKSEQEKPVPFTFINHSNSEITLNLSPVNFRQNGDYGEIGFEKIGIYTFPLASFFSLESDQLILAPLEKRTFHATVINRSDLSPGGHYVALVARVVAKGSDQATILEQAVSALVLIQKTGGERFNLSLKGSNFPRGVFTLFIPKKLTLLFQNEGNIHVVPYGRAEIRDVWGRKLYEGTINEGSLRVLPSSRRYITLEMVKSAWILPVSINTLEIRGHDSLDKVKFILKETFIYIDPWVFITVIVIITILTVIRRKTHPSKIQKK